MLIKELKKIVCEANLALVKHGLVVLTWGNVSGIDRERGIMVIKPSGVRYQDLFPEDMVEVDLNTGRHSGLRPSSDTPTHLELYRAFPFIGGVVHTHSINATAWAQAGRSIPPLGTTHADLFYGGVPCTRDLDEEEVESGYEKNTGLLIVKTFEGRDYRAVPAVLVRSHGPFIWGETPEKAVENAVTLEAVAEMALKTLAINPSAAPVQNHILEKHYSRKHGKNAYYGQTDNGKKEKK